MKMKAPEEEAHIWLQSVKLLERSSNYQATGSGTALAELLLEEEKAPVDSRW